MKVDEMIAWLEDAVGTDQQCSAMKEILDTLRSVRDAGKGLDLAIGELTEAEKLYPSNWEIYTNNLRLSATTLIAASAEDARREDNFRKFATAVLNEFQDALSDLDGGWLQDKAVECGLLAKHHVIESCGEGCRCSEYGFPTSCYRKTFIDAAIAAQGKEAK